LFIPLRMTKKENHALVYFIFALSIFSYGFQFELETGQYYTIALTLSLGAIYIFHNHPRYRIFAYVLFCLSVQLKVFPAIFAFLFVDNWRDWKVNLKRFAALGAANFLLLFLLGYSYFNLFIQRVINDSATQELEYNFSIYAFVTNLSNSGYGLFSGNSLKWIADNSGAIQSFLYIYFFVCLSIALVKAYRQNTGGFDASLFLVCLLGGMMIPAISHNYKLVMMSAPFALAMSVQNVRDALWANVLSIVLVTTASFAYSATLFPPNARPAALENSFPFLFVMLTAVVLLGFMQKPSHHEGH
jgi:hypothetical protein